MGKELDKKDAEYYLGEFEFFDQPGNRERFDNGDIVMYSEMSNMEASVILDKDTGQIAFVDWRGL